MSDLRIPFSVAVADPLLLRNHFEGFLSLPQRVALKVMYGAELDPRLRDDKGWSELDYYWAFQGYATFDDLGYILEVNPPRGAVYIPEEFQESWVIAGIRLGKSEAIASTVVAYEAVCGGHEQFFRKGKRAYCFQIAQDLPKAQDSLHGLRTTLESIPLLRANSARSKIQAVTARRIDLWNGITVATTPPTIKSVRGYDAPVVVMDEVGIWYQEADSANPDFQIYSQVNSRQAQFRDPKIVGVSSPWNKAGMLHSRFEAGTNGTKLRCEDHRGHTGPTSCDECLELQRPHKRRCVLYLTTAAGGNPYITREWLVLSRDRDPKVFERECLAKFQDSLSGFLDSDLLAKAVDKGVKERKVEKGLVYVAALDPAFRRDSFGFCIGHTDSKGKVIVDVLRRWTRAAGEPPLNPRALLVEVAALCAAYGIAIVATDQHQIDSFTLLANDVGLTVQEFNFSGTSKAEIYANLAALLNQGRIRLLDEPVTVNELATIERKLTQGGNVEIGAPAGLHDDMATVVALMAKQAVWFTPEKEIEVPKEPSLFERCTSQAQARFVETSAWD